LDVMVYNQMEPNLDAAFSSTINVISILKYFKMVLKMFKSSNF
jgi:hypothetical protein